MGDSNDKDQIEVIERPTESSVVAYWKKLGINLNTKDDMGETQLFLASKRDHKLLAEILIKYGSDVNIRNNYERTPLHLCSLRGHDRVVDVLLRTGADVNCQDRYDETPLSLASERGHKTIVRHLIKHGANVNLKNIQGRTALDVACLRGYKKKKVIKALLKAGASIDRQDRSSETALYRASRDGNLSMAKLLLDNGADINIMDCRLRTPPMVAKELYQERFGPAKRINDKSDIEIQRLFINHILLMMALDLHVCSKNYEWFRECTRELHIHCTLEGSIDECERMKNEFIGDSKVTFFDLLAKDEAQLAKYSRNEDIIRARDMKMYSRMFPIYAELIDTQLKKGQKQALFLNSIVQYLDCTFRNELPSLVIDKIMSYLTDEDFEILSEMAHEDAKKS